MVSSQTQGALFVIDGSDGSGKATQTKRLVERLRDEGFDVETVSFPRYGKKSCGLVEEYLSGKYGSAEEISAHAGSLFYALDRYDASFEIRAWMARGKMVVADRYVAANMGHQGSKITDVEERLAYLMWNDHLEHEVLRIPRPTVNIILSVAPEIAQQLALANAEGKAKVAKDIHENNAAHLRAAYETYKDIASRFPNFVHIDCAPEGTLCSVDEIHSRIWAVIAPLLPHRMAFSMTHESTTMNLV